VQVMSRSVRGGVIASYFVVFWARRRREWKLASGTRVFFHAYHRIDEPRENRTLETGARIPRTPAGVRILFSCNNPMLRSPCSLNLGLIYFHASGVQGV
jgi:hypothetical protein